MFPLTSLFSQIREDRIFISVPQCAIPEDCLLNSISCVFHTLYCFCCLEALTVVCEIFPPRNTTFNYLVCHNFCTSASVPRTCNQWTWRSEKGGGMWVWIDSIRPRLQNGVVRRGELSVVIVPHPKKQKLQYRSRWKRNNNKRRLSNALRGEILAGSG
jgi:hypothetical protein